MDKRKAQSWYVGVTHVLTSYFTAGFFTFVIVFFLGIISVLLQLNTENTRVYISLLTSLVFIPFFLFPATMYSVKFIMERYVIDKREAVLKSALISIAVLKIIIDWVSISSFDIANIISFLLSIAVFYGVSVQSIENNEFNDGIDLKNTVIRE